MPMMDSVTRLVRMASARFRVTHQCINTNLFHCCIQKSGSQWIKQILRDPVVFRFSGMPLHDLRKNFIKPGQYDQLRHCPPARRIISPFYVAYGDFESLSKPDAYKAFWVMRDPRDVVCSKYYSVRYSHPTNNPGLSRLRSRLENSSKENGLMHFISALGRRESPQLRCLRSWIDRDPDPRVLSFRYEDLVGQDHLMTFNKLFEHLDILIPESDLRKLLKRYSFEALSGRKRGEVDHKSHYRKGVVGDWHNHFSELHRKAFKESTGTLLVDLGYESNSNW